MGSASSSLKTFDKKYERPSDKSDKIEIFANEMYMSSPKIDALRHLLSEEAGQAAFMAFLRTEYAAENLQFFIVSFYVQKIPTVHHFAWNLMSLLLL